MNRVRAVLNWAVLICAIVLPIALAARSPFLAWRDPIYIIAGFAGIVGFVILLVQPMLAGAMLPGVSAKLARRVHRGMGLLLILAVIVHVTGLWITSPPDVVDVLLFRSPTPFSIWGLIAMWAVFGAACLVAMRRRLRPSVWHRMHLGLAMAIVIGTVVHAVQIEGTMEIVSKWVLSALVIAMLLKIAAGLRANERQRFQRRP